MERKRKNRILIIIILLIVLSVLIGIVFGMRQKNSKNKSESDITDEDLKSGMFIRYAYSYNIITADTLNEMSDYIDILKIELNVDEAEEIQDIIDRISFRPVDGNPEHPHTTAVSGTYELVLNEDEKILLDEEYAIYTNAEESYTIKISEDLFEYIEEIVNEELEKTYINIETNEITIYNDEEEEEITITNKDTLKKLTENYKYTEVNIEEDFEEFDDFSNVVDFNNGIKVYIYFASVLGYEIDENNNTKKYIAFLSDYENLVSNIYENYSNKLINEFEADKLIVKYKGRTYKIRNKQDIEKILNSLRYSEFSTPDWLDDFNESDYGEEDIVMEINDSKFIIPGNRNIGNRYFIDSKNKVYLIWYASDSNVESYLKELVEYEE